MSSGTSTPGSAPKSMSSRLLTMKFMQRAAASSPTVSTPATPAEPSSKRRKKDSDAKSPSAKFDVNALANQNAIQAAIATEEAKNQVALERAALDSGDSRWVLNFEDQRSSTPSLALRVVQTGYANLDAPSSFRAVEQDTEENAPTMVGRRSFGKFNKKLEKVQSEDDSDSSSEEDQDEDEESDEETDDDEDPAAQMIRASRLQAVAQAKEERRKRKRAEKAESQKLAKKRQKATVNLNGLTSLSGRGPPAPSIECFKCGGPHHKKDCPALQQSHEPLDRKDCLICGGPHWKSECPNRSKRGYEGGDDGPPRKTVKTK